MRPPLVVSRLLVTTALVLVAAPTVAATLLGPAKVDEASAAEATTLENAFGEAYADARGDRVLLTRTDAASVPLADPGAEARRLGASEYVSLSMSRTPEGILVRAARYEVSGDVLSVAKVVVPPGTDGATAMSQLARALVDEKTVAGAPAGSPRVQEPKVRPAKEEEEDEDEGEEPAVATPSPGPSSEVKRYETVLGPKMGVFGAWADGYSFAPMMTLGFDAKIEQDGYFIEVGGGATIPAANTNGAAISMGGAYVEMGAAAYLGGGDVGPYVGGGILPRIWGASGPYGGGAFANIAGYGQFGVMFLRTRSMRVYFDGRAALSITEVAVPGGYNAVTGELRPGIGLHPLEFGAEFGIGW